MMHLLRSIGAAGLVSCAYATPVFGGDVAKLDPALDKLIDPDAKVEIVKGGFGFTEGPVWVQKGKTGYLLFSDIPANVIYKLTPAGEASVYLDHSGYTKPDIWRVGFEFNNGRDPNDPSFAKFYMNGSNGLALDPQGRLVIATFAGRSIERIEPTGKRTVLADSYDGKRFNGTNDVAVKKDGAVYFTDMFGALRLGDKDPNMGLPYQAVYMVKNGKVTRLTDDIPTTNGLAFSPDEKYLYANGSRGKYIRRYDVKPDGTLTNSQMLIDMNADTAPGITDGMKVDTLGNIYSSGPGGIWIVAPDGKHIGTIRTPESVTNLAFGDADKKTLYITARPTIYKIPVKVPGI